MELPKFWVNSTTEQIRFDYAAANTLFSTEDFIPRKEFFDTWLKQVIKHAEDAAEERIIKLLEDLACDNPFCRKFGLMPSHTGCRAVRHHIALIKGEK